MTKQEIKEARNNLLTIAVILTVVHWFFPSTVILTLVLAFVFFSVCCTFAEPTTLEETSVGVRNDVQSNDSISNATRSYKVLDSYKEWVDGSYINDKVVAIDLFALAAAAERDFNVSLDLDDELIKDYIEHEEYSDISRAIIRALKKAGHPRLIEHMFKDTQGLDTVRYVVKHYS